MRMNGSHGKASMIANDNLAAFAEEVDMILSEGFRPIGGIIVSPAGVYSMVFAREEYAAARSEEGVGAVPKQDPRAQTGVPAPNGVTVGFQGGPEVFSDNFNNFAPEPPVSVAPAANIASSGAVVGRCPHCGGTVTGNGRGTYQCGQCGAKLYKHYGRVLSFEEARSLFSGQVVRLENLEFIDKMTGQKKTFTQNVVLGAKKGDWYTLVKAG